MSRIDVNLYEIATVIPKVKSFRVNRLDEVRKRVEHVRRGLDGQVLNSDNIGDRLLKVEEDIWRMEECMENVEKILKLVYEQYFAVENELYKKANDMNINISKQSVDEPNFKLFR